MTDNARDENVQNTNSGKLVWVAPQVETAPARAADAFGGPAGTVDYTLYS